MNIDWVEIKLEKPTSVESVLTWTPHNENIEYRILPLFMALKKHVDFTHWAYLNPPTIK